jgi:predicted NAD/FAD-dependent oxidoreductase
LTLISVVVLGNPSIDDDLVENKVRHELMEWFGPIVKDWQHLRTQRIKHALPDQRPPMPNPEKSAELCMPGVYVCGEYDSIPGIQWALLSGRQAAEEVIYNLGMHR